MTSKKSKKPKKLQSGKFVPRGSLGSSPSVEIPVMNMPFTISPPSGPRLLSRPHPQKPPPRHFPRQDSRDDSRGRYRGRSRSPPPYRPNSPPRGERRSWSRDRRRPSYDYENNYRPQYDSRSPVLAPSIRSPEEERRPGPYDSYRPALKAPLEERGINSNYPPLPGDPEPPRPRSPVAEANNQVSETSVAELTPEIEAEAVAGDEEVNVSNMNTVKPPEQAPAAGPSDQQPPLPRVETMDLDADDEQPPELDNELSKKLLDILNECADLASLKAKQDTEKQRLRRRQAEFEKFKPHHEKFPSTKESQTQAKEAAQKAYKRASDEIQQKQASLMKLTTEAAPLIAPSIVAGSGTGACSSDVEERLQKTADDYTKLLEEQKKMLAQQQQWNQRLEDRLHKKDQEISQLAKDNNDLKSTLETILTKVNGSDSSLQTIKDDMSKVKTTVDSQTKEQTDVTNRLTKSLSGRVIELDKMHSRLTKLESTSVLQGTFDAARIDLSKKCEKVEKDCQTNALKIENQTKSQNALAVRLTKAESNKVNKTDFDPLSAKVKTLETTARAKTPQVQPDHSILIKKHLEPLETQIAKISTTNDSSLQNLKDQITKINSQFAKTCARADVDSIKRELASLSSAVDGLKVAKSAPNSASAGVGADRADLSALQRQVDTIDSRLASHATGTDLNTLQAKVAHLEANKSNDLAEKRLTSLEKKVTDQDLSTINEMASFKTRLNAVEQRSSAPATVISPQGQAQQVPSNQELRLKKIEDHLEQLQGELDSVPDTTGEVVKEAVDHYKLDHYKLKQETTTAQLQASVANLEQRFGVLAQETKDSVQQVVPSIGNSVLQHLNSQNVYVRTLDPSFIDTIANVDSHELALANLQSRVDNINTADLHNSIVNTVLQNIPQNIPIINDFNARLSQFQSHLEVLQAVEPKVNELEGTVNSLNGTVNDLGGTVDTLSAETERVQSMRTEIDSLATNVSAAQSTAKEAAREIQKLSSAAEDDRDTITNLTSAAQNDRVSAADQFGKVQEQIDVINDKIENVEKSTEVLLKRKTMPTPTQPPPPARQVTSTSHRTTPTSTNPRPVSSRPGSDATTRRPSTASDRASVASDRGSVNENKKRPFKQTNGGSSLKGNDGPAVKRPRRRVDPEFMGDDPEKDPDFRPEDAGDVEVPTISDFEGSERKFSIPKAPISKSKGKRSEDVIDLVSD